MTSTKPDNHKVKIDYTKEDTKAGHQQIKS